jgi:chitodextrinase
MGFGASPSYIFGTPGVKHIRVIEKDSDNNTASYDITVTVAQNTPPTVTIKAPVPNQVIHVGESINLKGESSDPNEPGGQLACSSLSWTYQPTYIIWPASFAGVGCQVQGFKFSNSGYYTIALTGTDSMGATGTATVDVTVVDADAPWAYITGPLNEELQANQTATLTGMGYD